MVCLSLSMWYFFLLILLVCNKSSVSSVRNKKDATPKRSQCGIILENNTLNDKEINLAFQLSMLSGLSYADWSRKSDFEMKKTVEFEMHHEETSRTESLLSYLQRTSCEMSAFFRPKMNLWSNLKSKMFATKPMTSGQTYQTTLSETDSRVNEISAACVDINCSKSLCPAASFSRQTFQHLWFFNSWSENGIWHDTEVLISAHPGALAIVFRGSESVADVVTSSQFLEPARYSHYFRNVTHGSVHRGMFNAYHKVNRGEIVPLVRKSTSLWSRDREDARVDGIIRDAYIKCLLSRNDSSQHDNGTKLTTNKPCITSNVSLSALLVQTASRALRSGKQLYLSGHSLGGALATFLALDLLINSDESEAFLTDPLPEVPIFTEAEAAADGDDFTKATSKQIEELKQRQDKSPESKNKKHTFFNNIHLHTFGEPEIADNHFFHDLFSSFSHIGHFVMYRYKRFVGLSQSPSCKADVVTTLAARIAQVIGQSALGVGGGVQGRKELRYGRFWRTQKGQRPPTVQHQNQTLQDQVVQSQSMHTQDEENTSDTASRKKERERGNERGRWSALARKTERDEQNRASLPDLLAQLYNRLTEASFIQNNSALPFLSPTSHSSRDSDNAATATTTASEEAKSRPTLLNPNNKQVLDQELEAETRISYFAQPYYVCSEGAPSMLNAHRIHHYVRGIIHRKTTAMQQRSVRSSSGTAHKSSPPPPPLQHDVSLREAKEVDMADECFHAVGNGFYTYIC